MINVMCANDFVTLGKEKREEMHYAFISHIVEGKWILVITEDEPCYDDVMIQVLSDAPIEMAISILNSCKPDSVVYQHAKAEIEKRKGRK